jgi:hypothetical protein
MRFLAVGERYDKIGEFRVAVLLDELRYAVALALAAPRRLQTFIRTAPPESETRNPSCLISCSQPGPEGG